MHHPVLLMLTLSAPTTTSSAGLSESNWRAHPLIVAVRDAVGQIDAMQGGTGAGFCRCSSTTNAPQHPSFGIEIVEATARRAAGSNAERVEAKYDGGDAYNSDVNGMFAYDVTSYRLGDRTLFVHLVGMDTGLGAARRDIRVYFGPDGRPFWSVLAFESIDRSRTESVAHAGGLERDLSGWPPIPGYLRRWLTAAAWADMSVCSRDDVETLRRALKKGQAGTRRLDAKEVAALARFKRVARP